MQSYSYVVVLSDEFGERYFVTFCSDQMELTNLLTNLDSHYRLVSVEETWATVSTDYREFINKDSNLEFGKEGFKC